MDSVNGKPVSVGTEKVLSEICSEETVSCLKHLKENPGESGKPGTAGLHPHFTFFHSIGKEQGMMLAVTFERLCIQTQMCIRDSDYDAFCDRCCFLFCVQSSCCDCNG